MIPILCKTAIISFILTSLSLSSGELNKTNSKYYTIEDLTALAPVYVRQQKDIIEDGQLLVPELIIKYGYPCERHTITTSDGYILEIHRILPRTKSLGREPGIFVPGLISSSADWILAGPGKSLPLIMSDLGYDCWLLNSRGNRYSRKHLTLDADLNAKAFFNFSYHEISVIDVPEVIDYMLKITNHTQVLYFGHSQGTTISYVLCSEKPEYNAKLKAIFSFAPSAYFRHATPVYENLALYRYVLQDVFEVVKLYEYPRSYLQSALGEICADGSMFQFFCVEGLYFMFGPSADHLNATLLPILISHIPAGTSTKQGFHYMQATSSGKFRQFDYGKEGNMIQYGQLEPPDYKLERITAPIYMFYSKTDILNSEDDVLFLFRKLRYAKKYVIKDKSFNHIDFIFAVDALKLLFVRAINVLESLYSNTTKDSENFL